MQPKWKIEAYAYLLDLRQAPTLSTATYGLRDESVFDLDARLLSPRSQEFEPSGFTTRQTERRRVGPTLSEADFQLVGGVTVS